MVLAPACLVVTAVPLSLALLAQVLLAAKLQPHTTRHRQEKCRLPIQGKLATYVRKHVPTPPKNYTKMFSFKICMYLLVSFESFDF